MWRAVSALHKGEEYEVDILRALHLFRAAWKEVTEKFHQELLPLCCFLKQTSKKRNTAEIIDHVMEHENFDVEE